MSPTGRVRIGRIAVIGLGLIGGSVAAAARASGIVGHVTGVDQGAGAQTALGLGLVDSVSADPAQAVAGADLIVVATPVSAVGAVFAAIAPSLPPGALITDCASTKSTVLAAARARLGDAFSRYVPGHPIAGSERSGPSAARADLFAGKPWLFCPVNTAQRAHLPALEALVRRFGAFPHVLEAAQHDAMFAEYSHAPHAIVFALCLAIVRGPYAGDLTTLAGAGLRDTTRIGASSPALWADILLDNASATEQSLAQFDEALQALRAALRAGERDTLVELIGQGSRWRAGLAPPGKSSG